MLKSCATLSVRERDRGMQLREPRTSPSKRAVEASIGTDLRNYFRKVCERTAAGEMLTQEDLAAELGVSKTTVNKWLSDYGFEARTIYKERVDWKEESMRMARKTNPLTSPALTDHDT